ncbi:hypothetical protein JOM56_005742 [Amanita muscaria]
MATLTISADLIHKTYGAQLIGTLVATFLSGMNTPQTIVYFRVYHDDVMRLKALVAVIWGLDIIHTAFLWSNLWLSLIIKFGQVSSIIAIPKLYIVPGAAVVSSTMVFIVHMFYVHRIFRFSHQNYWITTPIVILVLGEMAWAVGGVVILYASLRDDINLYHLNVTQWTFYLGTISAAVSDIVIMVWITLVLALNGGLTIASSLNNVIDQLILYTFETGILTAFMAIAMMIAWLTEQRTNIYLCLFMAFPKVYATTLLGLTLMVAMRLNTRYYLRRDHDSQSCQGHNTAIRFANRSESTNPSMLSMQSAEVSTATQHQHIHVDVAKSVWIDNEIR